MVERRRKGFRCFDCLHHTFSKSTMPEMIEQDHDHNSLTLRLTTTSNTRCCRRTSIEVVDDRDRRALAGRIKANGGSSIGRGADWRRFLCLFLFLWGGVPQFFHQSITSGPPPRLSLLLRCARPPAPAQRLLRCLRRHLADVAFRSRAVQPPCVAGGLPMGRPRDLGAPPLIDRWTVRM
jgi:hypothetical protein